MLSVIKEASLVAPDRSRCRVVVESRVPADASLALAIEELQSQAARDIATAHACESGITGPRIEMKTGGVYAVNAAGQSVEEVRGPNGEMLATDHPARKIAGYRKDINLVGANI